jgi:hypothetical protein
MTDLAERLDQIVGRVAVILDDEKAHDRSIARLKKRVPTAGQYRDQSPMRGRRKPYHRGQGVATHRPRLAA